MQYNGGKNSVGKRWAGIIQPKVVDTYWEPFGGVFGVGQHIVAKRRIYSDADRSIVFLMHAVSQGWSPPAELSQDQYYALKNSGDQQNPLYGFAAFGCSFAGKKWGGYARSRGDNFALRAKRKLEAMAPRLVGVEFYHCDFTLIVPEKNWVVYADPPYAGTTKVGAGVDNKRFDQWVQGLSCPLFLSEYGSGLEIVDDFGTNKGLLSKGKSSERLFFRP